MERSDDGDQTLARSVVHWRSIVLIGVSVAGGLVLTAMVIGATPTVGGEFAAAPEGLVAARADVGPSTTVTMGPVTVQAIPGPTDVVVDSTQAPLATLAVGDVAAGLGAPAVGPTRPVSTPTTATTSPVPATAAPATLAPTAPTPTSPATVAPTAPPPTAPVPTATATAPSPTAPAPTAPAPTVPTPIPVTLSFPRYTVSGASEVTLQFDGSSIAVASVSPQANWVYEIEKNGARTVEIKFFNIANGSDREFHATVENGRIKAET